MNTIKVWDPFVRIGHWLLVGGFLVAYLSGDEWMDIHVWAGYLVFGVVVFRIMWGAIGPRPAQFRSFVQPFSAVKRHMSDLLRLRPRAYAGHNPAGGWMVVALLATLLLVALSGIATLGTEGEGPLAGTAIAAFLGEEGWEEVHEILTNLALVLVAVHIGGVVMESIFTHENLPKSMVTGIKHIHTEEKS